MKRTWQILNIVSVIFALIMNFIVGARLINVPSIGSVSDTYATLLTPATYAFAIWSVIYLLLVVFAVYQARDIVKPTFKNDIPLRAGPYFILANIGNAVWTYIFVSDLIGLSVMVLFGMVASLFILLRRLDIATYDAPLRTIVCVWWPLMIYTGWVLVASVVNFASWLASLGIALSSLAGVIILVALCCILLGLMFARGHRELVLASVWGIAAIGFRQIETGESLIILTASFTVTIILLATAAINGYQNRHHNILNQVFHLRP